MVSVEQRECAEVCASLREELPYIKGKLLAESESGEYTAH